MAHAAPGMGAARERRGIRGPAMDPGERPPGSFHRGVVDAATAAWGSLRPQPSVHRRLAVAHPDHRNPGPPAAFVPVPDVVPWAPALVRAVGAAPGVQDAPLAETTFAPAELPNGEKAAIYYQITIPPGASLAYLGGPFCGCRGETIASGVGVEVVQSGTYSLQLEAPLRVQRAGSSRPGKEIPAGTTVTLTAGDVAIYPDYAAAGDIRNAGADPVTLLGVAIIAPEGSGTPVPTPPTGLQATLLAHIPPADWTALPPGPLHLALRQLSLPPGAEHRRLPAHRIAGAAHRVRHDLAEPAARGRCHAERSSPRASYRVDNLVGSSRIRSARNPRQHGRGASRSAGADHRTRGERRPQPWWVTVRVRPS